MHTDDNQLEQQLPKEQVKGKKQPTQPKSTKISKLPLAISLLALIGAGWAVSNQYFQERPEVQDYSHYQTQITALQNTVTGLTQQLQTQQQSQQASQQSIRSYTAQRIEQNNAQVAGLTEQINAMRQVIDSPQTNLVQQKQLFEMQSGLYSLIYAQQALVMMGDPQLAQQWTKNAQQALSSLPLGVEVQPQFTEIQQSLSNTPSAKEVRENLIQLMISLKDLTLKTPYVLEASEKNDQPSDIWSRIKSLVSVQKFDSTSQILWTEQDRMEAVQTIRLAMIVAQAQLLQGDTQAYQHSVADINRYVTTYFVDNTTRADWLASLGAVKYPSHQHLVGLYDQLIIKIETAQQNLQENK